MKAEKFKAILWQFQASLRLCETLFLNKQTNKQTRTNIRERGEEDGSKVFASKPDDLNSALGTHGERKEPATKVALSLPQAAPSFKEE